VLVVALTGGIGSGKSTVSAGLATRGASVIDADGIAREVVAPGAAAYDPLVARFGRDILHPDGTLNRPALAAVVFADPPDPAALADLNAITHPAIAAGVLDRITQLEAAADGPAGTIVIDTPLLEVLADARDRIEALLVVDTPEEVAVSRLREQRGFSEEDARARVRAQISREERCALADLVIANGGDRAALEGEIDRAWAWLQARATRG
jgi:dephospho-CoA kinase